jgi:glutamate dehydrogenase (NAD(P)+)
MTCKEHAGIPHPQYALLKAYTQKDSPAIQSGIDRLTRGTSLPLNESLHMYMSDSVTGWTVAVSAGEALNAKGENVRGKRVAVQGFGAVGGSAAKFLSDAGAVVVAVSDELGALVANDEKGLDVGGLLKIRRAPGYKVIDREELSRRYTYETAGRDDVLYEDVDILVPAAGSYLPVDIERIKATLIVEGANDPFTGEQEDRLYTRGITVIPDAIANCGSAGLYGLLVSGKVKLETGAMLNALSDAAKRMTRRVLEEDSAPPRVILERIARMEIRNRIAEGHSVTPHGLSKDDLGRLESQDLRIRYRETSPYSIAQPVGHP